MGEINQLLQIVLAGVFWLHGIIVLSSSLFIAYVYWKQGDAKLKHIVAVALSHAIYTGLAITAYFWEVFNFYSARGFFVFLAFLLTDYGLIQIFIKSWWKFRER